MAKHQKELKNAPEGKATPESPYQSAVFQRADADRLKQFAGDPSACASSVLAAPSAPAEADLLKQRPPWSVVQRYLKHGEHRAWVEAHARASQAFADVLEALRHDHQARGERSLARGARRRARAASTREHKLEGLACPAAAQPEGEGLLPSAEAAPPTHPSGRAGLRLLRGGKT